MSIMELKRNYASEKLTTKQDHSVTAVAIQYSVKLWEISGHQLITTRTSSEYSKVFKSKRHLKSIDLSYKKEES